jgi:predicted DNA-binding transcriptional regulator YafY
VADAAERLVNLALHLAGATGTVTAAQIRESVFGYPADQDEVAFKRMLERDKDDLRSSGFVIVSDDEGNYRLDRAATYVSSLTLAPEEAAAVRAAGTAALRDPSFPFAADLRLALAKVAAEVRGAGVDAASRLADESPEHQGSMVAELSSAARSCKRATFSYTDSAGRTRSRTVEPYGLFLHDGRWYLVGNDVAKQKTRTFAVTRMADVLVNAAAPKTPDFERPPGFDVGRFVRLPFQFGAEQEFEAVLRFDATHAWRAESLAAGHGSLEHDGDGALWRVRARSAAGLCRFVIENGPGIAIVAPAEVRALLAAGVAHAEARHV